MRFVGLDIECLLLVAGFFLDFHSALLAALSWSWREVGCVKPLGSRDCRPSGKQFLHLWELFHLSNASLPAIMLHLSNGI